MEQLLTLYSEVQSTDVRWLWYPFIAIGKITLLQGDPGDGKSTMMMNLIAELSTGGMQQKRAFTGMSTKSSLRKMKSMLISRKAAIMRTVGWQSIRSS